MVKRLSHDDIDHFMEYGIDVVNRIIDASSVSLEEGEESGVNYALYKQVIKGLEILKRKNPDEPITIILNNPGGDEYHCWAIINSIQNCKNTITIQVRGQASSAGSMILQAADKREIQKDAILMIHYGSWGFSGHSLDFLASAKECEKQNKKMEDLFLEKIKIKKPTFTRNNFKRKFSFDVYMSAKEALEWNLVDEII